jgi:hypothetical protein
MEVWRPRCLVVHLGHFYYRRNARSWQQFAWLLCRQAALPSIIDEI